MSSVICKPADELNRNMIKFMPELDSEYARYPMKYDRWLQPQEKTPKGEPCFIKSTQDSGVKKDYVWCKYGNFGPGYYHLLTKIAYVNLYNRIDSIQPGICGIGCSSADRKLMDEHDDVKRLLYGRHMSPRPCDKAADKRAMDESQGMAQAAYTMDQGGLPNPNKIKL